MEPFDNVSKVLATAEEVIQLKAVCKFCNEDATFNLRITENEDLIAVGGEDMYKPVCRVCYLEFKLGNI